MQVFLWSKLISTGLGVKQRSLQLVASVPIFQRPPKSRVKLRLVSGRSTSLAVGRLSDPINSQGVNKQLTASGGGEGDGRGREGGSEGGNEGRKGGEPFF